MARDLELQGITTDGSPLYPEPICTFHVLKELTQGILRAVAAEHSRLATSKPKMKRSRPSSKDKTARRLARKSKTLQEKLSGLFQGRFWFIKRRLKPRERKQLLQITRGLPHLRKLREIMDHIYVRSQVSLEGRIALDMIREFWADNRAQSTQPYIRHAGALHDSESLLPGRRKVYL